jgi:phasin family protein
MERQHQFIVTPRTTGKRTPDLVAPQQNSLEMPRSALILEPMVQCSNDTAPPAQPIQEILMLTAEQFTAVQKANVETLFGLTNKAFEGVEKLVELNLQVAKTALGEVAENTRAALSVKDAQELVTLQAALLQPSAEKAAAYGRHLYDIAASTGAEVTKVAEQTATEAQQKFMAVVDTAVKNAPAGTENAVALVKSAVAAANNAYESVHKAAKQAAEVAEANFQAVTSTAVKATQGSSKAKRATAA